MTEPLPWKGGLVGINSFGFGGSNVHVILKSPDMPSPQAPVQPALPVVVPASGRTEEGVKKLLQFAKENIESKDLISLLTEISAAPLNTFPYRGYIIINSENNIEEVVKVQSNPRPVWYVFSGMGTQWTGMGEKLMQIPTFCNSIHKTAEILKEFGLDLVKIIMESDGDTYSNTINSFVGLASIQIALVDCLKGLGKFLSYMVQPSICLNSSISNVKKTQWSFWDEMQELGYPDVFDISSQTNKTNKILNHQNLGQMEMKNMKYHINYIHCGHWI